MNEQPNESCCQFKSEYLLIGGGLISAIGSLGVLSLRQNLSGPLIAMACVGIVFGSTIAALGCYQTGFFRRRTLRHNPVPPPVELEERVNLEP